MSVLVQVQVNSLLPNDQPQFERYLAYKHAPTVPVSAVRILDPDDPKNNKLPRVIHVKKSIRDEDGRAVFQRYIAFEDTQDEPIGSVKILQPDEEADDEDVGKEVHIPEFEDKEEDEADQQGSEEDSETDADAEGSVDEEEEDELDEDELAAFEDDDDDDTLAGALGIDPGILTLLASIEARDPHLGIAMRDYLVPGGRFYGSRAQPATARPTDVEPLAGVKRKQPDP
ncbi:hypothetical protein CC1G_09652 [Coprinopsis cinerea okayama7|uniref:Uncharacterized protein n=1 Tax=Coprinopsis cinerea (strain Okayama-7 / 130 / ATCC MYA-4618 / FGSC 9003) TaxID=240176 RepID=A8P9D8_COPC7|nr:hypothetical protein CC1G_09652 [Coprinopsis cinerea okayama7\|eukprot:XP_001839749.1 hypothetical protein CC1G_09652 [Coprinopsis cinerea okayama7\